MTFTSFPVAALMFRKPIDDIKPVPEYHRSGKAMNATCKVTRQLAPVSARVNAILKYGDPDHYAEAVRLRDLLRQFIPSYHSLCTDDILVYEGREFLFNCRTGDHVDKQDPEKSYAILAAFGNFQGGHVRVKHLGLRMRFLPGDVIALRGRVLPHEVEVWEGGQRISIPHFTHSSLWRCMGIGSVFTT